MRFFSFRKLIYKIDQSNVVGQLKGCEKEWRIRELWDVQDQFLNLLSHFDSFSFFFVVFLSILGAY